MGPNNYGNKEAYLLSVLERNSALTRLEVMHRLGHEYSSVFEKAKHRGLIVTTGDLDFRGMSYWRVKERRDYSGYRELYRQRRQRKSESKGNGNHKV